MKEKNKMISAGIVLFNPIIDRLLDNIRVILPQVDFVFLFQNSISKDVSEEIKKLEHNNKIILLGNGNNIGLAGALNEIMQKSLELNCEWCITFDQDSISPRNMVEEYSNYFNESDVGIICPQVIDNRRPYMKVDSTPTISYVNRCITSASCTNLKIWKKLGGFDEFLFIDLIDNDFCKRLMLNNYKILRVNNIVLNQQFGDIKLKKASKVKFYLWVAKLFSKFPKLSTNIAKFSYKKNVSPLRVYYSNRNVIYLNKKYKNHGGIGYDCYSCKTYLGFNICFNFASLLRGKQKLKIYRAIRTGKQAGKKANVIPYSLNGGKNAN